MSDLPLLLLAMVAVVNPAAVALAASAEAAPTQEQRRRLAVPALALAAVLVGGAALLHEQVIDALDVSAASFEAAAGFVLLAAALVTLLRGRSVEAGLLAVRSPRGYVVALGFPVSAGPAVLVAAIAYAERSGVGVTLAGGALALGLAALASAAVPATGSSPIEARRALWLGVAARLLAALLAALAVGLIVDGLRAV
jgi:multiple antibiotic resistance protein